MSLQTTNIDQKYTQIDRRIIPTLLREKTIEVSPTYVLSIITLEDNTRNPHRWQRIQEEAGKDTNLISYGFEIQFCPNFKERIYFNFLTYTILLPINYTSYTDLKEKLQRIKGLSQEEPGGRAIGQIDTKGGLHPKNTATPIQISPEGEIKATEIKAETYLQESPTVIEYLQSPAYTNRHRISKLKTVDVTKIGRLSLKGVKLPAQEVRTEAPPQPESTPPAEELAFTDRPILKPIAERFDLEVLRVRELLEKERRYSKKEAIEQIVKRVGGGLIDSKKAEQIFNKMIDKRTIEPIGDTDYYHLSGSTPF